MHDWDVDYYPEDVVDENRPFASLFLLWYTFDDRDAYCFHAPDHVVRSRRIDVSYQAY